MENILRKENGFKSERGKDRTPTFARGKY